MKNIYLIGMPGCGKSTIGKIISGEINCDFIDLDAFITEDTGKAIDELFKMGESHFRSVETACLKKVSTRENLVVATGGGIIVTDGNADIMKKSGRVIFIDTPPDQIIKNSDLDGRPLLADNKDRIYELFEKRYALYLDAADVVVKNVGSIDEAVEKIIYEIKNP